MEQETVNIKTCGRKLPICRIRAGNCQYNTWSRKLLICRIWAGNWPLADFRARNWQYPELEQETVQCPYADLELETVSICRTGAGSREHGDFEQGTAIM